MIKGRARWLLLYLKAQALPDLGDKLGPVSLKQVI